MTTIFVLLFGRCPPAIGQFVSAVDVDPIKRRTSGARSHVRQEVAERTPPCAHRDATTAIVTPAIVIWIAASTAHRLPRLICRVFVSAVRFLATCIVRHRKLSASTPTALRLSRNKTPLLHAANNPARTSHLDHDSRLATTASKLMPHNNGLANNRPPIEFLANEHNVAAHTEILL